MKMDFRYTIIVLFVFVSTCIFSQTVRIGILNDQELKTLVVSNLTGKYTVKADSLFLMDLQKDDLLYITIIDNNCVLRTTQKPIGSFRTIQFIAHDTNSVLRVTPIFPKATPRTYSDNLTVSVFFNRLLVVNEVQIDNYLAGVVDAETGPNATIELYKAQSVLARTFLYGHEHRHASEGFDLCDGVHCQAYKGRSVRNMAVMQGTKATSGIVVLDKDSSLITAVFHANCGGETESSFNAWVSGKSYLVSVKDPFCQNSSIAKWEKKIKYSEWRSYLQSHGFKINDKISPIQFDFTQINRKQYYKIKSDSMPFKQIRVDFQLRSTYFSVIADSNYVTLKGKGYGHGVGMCQEGAIQMAKIGYKYTEILNYYFKGVVCRKMY